MIANARTPSEIEPASAHLVRQGVGALLVGTDVLGDAWADAWKDPLLGLTARRDLPAIYPLRRFAEAGGLMSYEADLSYAFQLAAVYTARILKGWKPGDLSVQQSRVQLVVNRNTAKWLGIDLPASILSHADDIID